MLNCIYYIAETELWPHIFFLKELWHIFPFLFDDRPDKGTKYVEDVSVQKGAKNGP